MVVCTFSCSRSGLVSTNKLLRFATILLEELRYIRAFSHATMPLQPRIASKLHPHSDDGSSLTTEQKLSSEARDRR